MVHHVTLRRDEPRSRLSAGRTVFRFLNWMVRVNPQNAWVSLFLELLDGFLPVCSVWIVRIIFGQAVLVYEGTSGLREGILIWVGVWAGLKFLQEGLFVWMRQLFTERLRHELEDSMLLELQGKAARLRLEVFERPDFYDLLRRARDAARPGFFLALLWELFGIIRAGLTVVSVSVLVGAWNPILLVALLLVFLPGPITQIVQARTAYFVERAQTDVERTSRYLQYLLTSREGAKEVRILDLGPLFVDWWRRTYRSTSDIVFQTIRKQQMVRLALAAVSILGLTLAVGWSAWTSIMGGCLQNNSLPY